MKREQMPNLLDEILSDKITEVTDMPACSAIEVSRIPKKLPCQEESAKADIDLSYVSIQRQPMIQNEI